ncbi:MAG: glutamyl-tRNA reductase [bacterium]
MPAKLISIGLSHHAVPVELREKVTFSQNEIGKILLRMKDVFADEALLISTCNRTELYLRPLNEELSSDYLIDFLLEAKALPADERALLKREFVKRSYCDAIIHLFEVISGIDSQILGDQQIFGQIKDAFRIAEEVGATGTFMTKLAHAGFHVAKRVRSETDLVVGAGTVSYAAVEFARKVFDGFSDRVALIIGAGETAELSAGYLADKGIGKLFIANRTPTTAEALVKELATKITLPKIEIISLMEIDRILHTVDIVISSTGSDDIILHVDTVESALRLRKTSLPMVLIDIAVPRDIDPAIGKLPQVFLKDIDDLADIVDQNSKKRKDEIPKINSIINQEFESFLDLFTKLEVGPTIASLREKFERIRLEELESHRSKLSNDDYERFDQMTRKVINRLLHTPTVMLKAPRTTKDDLQARIELVRMLFALDSEETERNHGA